MSNFEVGQRYLDRLGEYEVLSIQDGMATYRYDDGRVATHEVQAKLRIHLNIVAERKAAEAPPVIVKRGRTIRMPRLRKLGIEYQSFLDLLRENATIRVQTPRHALANFALKYHQMTGEEIGEGDEHVSIVTERSKWGASMTVLFPKELYDTASALAPPGLNIRQEYCQGSDSSAIFGEDFIWGLISDGFRLGHNHYTPETTPESVGACE